MSERHCRCLESDKVRDLLDKEEIRELLHRYCRANDRGDASMLRTVFHPDAVDDHGAFHGDIPGFIEHVDEMFSSRTPFGTGPLQNMHHSLGTINIKLEGDIAYTESYFVSLPITKPDDNGKVTIAPMYGRYLDVFERRDDRWRIIKRKVVKDVRDVRVVRENPDEAYAQGTRSETHCNFYS